MPEGHTLHRLALTLDRAFAGGPVQVSSPQGRFSAGAALLDGLLMERAEAWGKHLFVTFEGEHLLNVHLGLIGVFDVNSYAVQPGSRLDSPPMPPPPVGAVRVRLVNETHVADLRGATQVEIVTPEQLDATVARLGPDPLRVGTPGNDPERSLAKLARTDRTVAELLMDQSVIAGVGNLYRAEVLWRNRIDPFTPGRKVKKSSWLTLWDDLVDLMPLGVSFGQILTLEEQVIEAKEFLAQWSRDHAAHGDGAAYLVDWRGGDEGEAGRKSANQARPAYERVSPFPREFAVYKRQGEPCLVCGSRIRTQVLAGRNLFWCGRCQRRH